MSHAPADVIVTLGAVSTSESAFAPSAGLTNVNVNLLEGATNTFNMKDSASSTAAVTEEAERLAYWLWDCIRYMGLQHFLEESASTLSRPLVKALQAKAELSDSELEDPMLYRDALLHIIARNHYA